MTNEKNSEQEMAGINPLIDLLGGDDIEQVEIKDRKGKRHLVDLDLPALKQVRATKYLFAIRDKLIGLNVTFPARNDGESDDEFHLRVGTEMMGSMTDVLLSMMSEEVIEASAIILGRPVEEVGDEFNMEELVVLVVPFFKRVFGRLLSRGSQALNLETRLNGLGNALDSSLTPDSSPSGSEETSHGEKSESQEPSSQNPKDS
jgi:hypothetical protein